MSWWFLSIFWTAPNYKFSTSFNCWIWRTQFFYHLFLIFLISFWSPIFMSLKFNLIFWLQRLTIEVESWVLKVRGLKTWMYVKIGANLKHITLKQFAFLKIVRKILKLYVQLGLSFQKNPISWKERKVYLLYTWNWKKIYSLLELENWKSKVEKRLWKLEYESLGQQFLKNNEENTLIRVKKIFFPPLVNLGMFKEKSIKLLKQNKSEKQVALWVEFFRERLKFQFTRCLTLENHSSN